jgi:hypothetical protein
MDKYKTPPTHLGSCRYLDLSRFVPRGFGFVHHSRTLFCRAVPNLNLTTRTFFAAVEEPPAPPWRRAWATAREVWRVEAGARIVVELEARDGYDNTVPWGELGADDVVAAVTRDGSDGAMQVR